MKGKGVKFGILCLMAVFALAVLGGCKTEGDDGGGGSSNPLIGTWAGNGMGIRFNATEIFTCSNTSASNPTYNVYGTYTVNGGAITISVSNSQGTASSQTCTFTINGSLLSVTGVGNASSLSGQYTKQ